MPRINIWIPDELHATAKRELPGLNLSALVQRALVAKLDCTHQAMVCRDCSSTIDRHELRDEWLGVLFVDIMRELNRLAVNIGTAEGAARVVLELGRQRQITAAKGYPLERPSRSRRKAKADNDWVTRQPIPLPREADTRRRHPTARRKSA